MDKPKPKKPIEHKGRPKHPPCPACGKALYKQMDGSSVAKEAPWAFCRNKACKKYAANQAEASAPKVAPLKLVKPLAKLPAASKAPPPAPGNPFKEMAESLAKAKKPAEEPEEIKRARARIKAALAVNGTYTKAVVGLTLTIVAQELGDKEIADRLIDEFKLTETYGIEKQSPGGG